MKKIFLAFALCYLAWASALSQVQISGQIIDSDGQPVFAANIFLQSKVSIGTISDFEGKFSIALKSLDPQDSLIISSVGYEQTTVSINDIPENNFIIAIAPYAFNLSGVEVIGTNPISESFAVETLNQLQIYLNPAANADPLKAIAASASSTNTDESANPNLRGSTADRSQVLIHGVPIYRPVRNSQINGIGLFSIFNTALLDQLQVYASNPPLQYGNSSAGLVEIQFKKEVQQQNFQVSTGLASSGLLWSAPVNDKLSIRSFINYQYAKPFIALNKNSITDLNDFQNLDAGIQWYAKLNDQWSIQAFHYGIKEGVDALSQIYTYQGNATAGTFRNFNVISSRYQKGDFIIDINHGSDFSQRDFSFGNLDTQSDRQHFFHSFNLRHYPTNNWNYQVGISHNYNHFSFRDTFSLLYYAYAENIPTGYFESSTSLHQLEPYAYTSWSLHKKWLLSLGLRTNIPIDQRQNFWSYQGSIRHSLNSHQSFLLGFGKYHSYRYPGVGIANFEQLSSQQISLDYSYQKENSILQAAVFYKKEKGGRFSELFPDISSAKILGTEISWQRFFGKYWDIELSNIFIRQRLFSGEKEFRGNESLNYFVRAIAQFNHPKYLNAAIFFQARPGRRYTPVVGANLNPSYNIYEPIYANEFNTEQFNAYQRIDFSLSKEIPLTNSSIIAYLTLSNFLNAENQRSVLYNEDYTNTEFTSYMRRIIYFGTVWSW